MMLQWHAWADLVRDVIFLRNYIKYIKLVQGRERYSGSCIWCHDFNRANQEIGSFQVKFALDLKIYNYSSIIVYAYASYERFVRRMMEEYFYQLEKVVPEFSLLPDAFRTSHLRRSFELVRKLEYKRYSHISESSIVEKLHKCHVAGRNYVLNWEALLCNFENAWYKSVKSLFSSVGIENLTQRILALEFYNKFFVRKGFARPEAEQEDFLFKEINDLVERRNEVAHDKASDIPSFDDIGKMFTSLLLFCKALIAILEIEIARFTCATERQRVICLFVFGNRIACVQLSHEIKVGDFLISYNGRDKIEVHRILSIHVNDYSISSVVPAQDRTHIAGLCVTGRIKQNDRLYIYAT